MSGTGIDLLDPAFVANPYSYYRQLRDETPIVYDPDWKLWLVSRYEDVSTLLRDRRLGRSILHVMSREELGWPPDPQEMEPFIAVHRGRLMDSEPPDHTRLRSLVQKAFTPRMVEDLRPQIQCIVDDLLDRVQLEGEMDLLEDFAVPLPVTVIAELLGVPEADRHRLRPWSRDIVAMYELSPTEADARQAVKAVVEFSDYLKRLAAERRRSPRVDLISELARVEEGGERLSEIELISICILLLNAGHEATVNVIGNGVLALLRHPEQLARLQNDPGLVRSGVEEMMRYDTPLQMFKRWVLESFEYKGKLFERGSELALFYGSANRDPARFPDPDAFDAARTDNAHISFGLGTHYCLGAPLARAELQIAVGTLLRRLPGLRLLDEKVEYRPTLIIRGLKSLRVGF